MKPESKNICLSFAIRQDCLLATWQGDNEPTFINFPVVDKDGGLLEFDKVMVGKTPLTEFLVEGDKFYTEVGGPSIALCLQALERGLDVFRYHSYELTQLCERGEVNPKDRKERFNLLVSQVIQGKSAEVLPNQMLDVDKPVLRIGTFIAAYVQIQQEQRIRAEQRAAVRNRNLAWMPGYRFLDKLLELLAESRDVAFYKDVEDKFIAAVKGELPSIPVWMTFLEGVNGCGPSIAGRLIGNIGDIRRFPKLGGFRSYCGFAVKDGRMVKFARGKDDDGKRTTFSPSLRQALYLFCEQIVRGGEGNPYNANYKAWKAYYTERNAVCKEGLSKGHIEKMARRAACSYFVNDLWKAYWKAEEARGTKLPQSVYDVIYAVDTINPRTTTDAGLELPAPWTPFKG